MNEYKKVVYYTSKEKPDMGKDAMYIQHYDEWAHHSGGYGNLISLSKIKPYHKKLRFYHSYWSRPALTSNRWSIKNQHYLSLIYTSVSVLYLKALGQEVVLHTDEQGAVLLSCLPYDQIIIDLEDNPCPTLFWASGKFLPLLNGEDGIHIDTDLFITNSSVIRMLDENDFVVTHIEETKAYKDLITSFVNMFDAENILHPFNKESSTSINCGLLKIPTDLRLKYAHYYLNFVYKIENTPSIFNSFSIEKQSLYSPDLVIEQLLLKELASYYSQPFKTISSREDLFKQNKITHLLSYEKYILIPFLVGFLKKENNSFYQTIVNLLNSLDFQLIVL
jgi:hypothetical protein